MENLWNTTFNFWIDNADPRGAQWLLTSSVFPIIIIDATFLLLVLHILPSILKSKKYENYKFILATYYVIHSLLSAFFACLCIVYLIALHIHTNYHFDLISVRCIPIVQSFEGIHYEIAVWMYVWLWFKISEMIETILIIIVYGRTTTFNVIHHSLHPLMLAMGMHFYLGGSGAIFGFLNNVEHAFLYFIVAVRMASNQFKKRSQPWFKKFHLIISIGALIVSAMFFVPLRILGPCEYETFNTVIFMCLLIFLCLSITCRWNYISHKDAFGRTKLIVLINKKVKLISMKH
ncbi:hypothetical protein ACKWTF_015995 [Chironomus riparius]